MFSPLDGFQGTGGTRTKGRWRPSTSRTHGGPAPPGDLTAVRAAARGHVPIDPRVAGALLPSTGGTGAVDGLSPRETEVLRLVAQGLANKQIARALGITERTVKAHLGRVFREIGVLDRTSAALWARDHLPGA